MAKIYISSTYEDLKKEREAAAQAVRRLGHQSIAMEDYVASDKRPVEKCLQDVRSCNVYVGIFAWRYGFIPPGYDKSITHLEYETAKEAGIPCLIFLLDQEAPWPKKYIPTGEESQKIDKLRSELEKDHIVSFFKNTDELSSLVSPAVSELILTAERSFIKFKKPGELIGTKLGKYEIREKLGRGGKGVVFKVLDTLEESTKAIKMVPPSISDSSLAFNDLKQELKTAARIIHPNVVKVLGLEEYDGHFFIVMEYIQGKNLEQLLAESKERKLKETEIIDIMQQMAQGLLETHKNNIIHRDIKPANIMVTPGGQVKILDFGISYQVTLSMTQLVGEHQWMGTWPYMAPEQLTTRYGREDNQVDIWGFGVTMYQLLNGELPFRDKDQIKDINEKPFELEGVSDQIRNIVMKCLEKDRKKRWQNMEEVLDALKSISSGTRKPVKKKRIEPVDNKPQPKPPTKKIPPDKSEDYPEVPADVPATTKKTQKIAKKRRIESVDNKPQPKPSTKKEKIPPDKKEDFPQVKGAKKVYKNKQGFTEADYGDGIIMVYIPPGEFKMGSNNYDDEKPPHSVYLDGYWIGKFEVTVSQFKIFVNDTGYVTEAESSGGAYAWTGLIRKKWKQKKGVNWKNPGFEQEDNHPVVCISWNDVNKYCKWLSKKKGLTFKLPTEAQWEKAARGTGSRKYPWGNKEPDKKLANFKFNVGKTTPVDSYPKGVSPYGLLDMAGNVWEWCQDWYDENYYQSSLDKNPKGPKSGSNRVIRGGSWYYYARFLRCAGRDFDGPSISASICASASARIINLFPFTLLPFAARSAAFGHFLPPCKTTKFTKKALRGEAGEHSVPSKFPIYRQKSSKNRAQNCEFKTL
jgi:formylglycine-generating enzyme required for sulfatase activity